MRRRDIISVPALGLASVITSALGIEVEKLSAEYTGKLEPELVPEFSFMSSADLSHVPDPMSAGTTFALPADAALFKGELEFVGPIKPLKVLLIESVAEGAQLCADLNHDGRFADHEIFKFLPVPQRPKAIGDVLVPVAQHLGPFRSFPIRLRLFPDSDQPGGPAEAGKRTIFYSFTAYATGTAKIGPNTEPLRIWCQYHPESGQVDPLHGVVGMDISGDGILAAAPSAERAIASGGEVVFNVHRKYLSIHRIDIASRTFSLQSHSESDDIRVQLEVGAMFPDFEFTDFHGYKHRLSDINGRYVLLNFWGSWCGPCLAEIPYLIRAYQEFRVRGFQIIGIDAKEPSAKAYECITKNELPWLQATPESTAELLDERLNILTFPTLILLDHDRRIVSLDSSGPKLRGENLIRTLVKLLPQH